MKNSLSPAIVASFAIAIVSASPSLGRTAWRQYGFDPAHSSFNSAERILTRDNVSELAFRWGTNFVMPIPSVPTVGRGMVFFASDGNVVAADATTGIEIRLPQESLASGN